MTDIGEVTQKIVSDPAVAFTVQISLDGSRQLMFQTALERDAPVERYHEVLNKISDAIEMQAMRSELPALLRELEMDERGLETAMENFEFVEVKNETEWRAKKKQGEPKLSPAEQANKLSFGNNVKAFRRAIEKKKTRIAELKEKLGEV